MSASPLAASGLLVGLAYGYAAQRGAFCMNSGFRVAATRRDLTKVKALLLAVAIQAVALPVLFAAGLPRPGAMPFQPIGAVVGGLAFGAAMKSASGCAAGAWYKLGGGSLPALFVFFGITAGAALAGVALPSLPLPAWSLPAPPAWLAPLVGVGVLVGLAFAAPGKAGAWSWRKAGTVIGIIALGAWPLSALAGRDFGVAVIPGAVALLGAPASPSAALSWDALFVLGIPAGAWAAARRDGPVKLKVGSRAELGKALIAGLVLGASAALAKGCTVGHGLAGLPILSAQSIATMAAIFAGSALVALRDERRAADARAAGTPA
ncbi:MAG: YeeE/YedE family protein [Myxococcota bacterium]